MNTVGQEIHTAMTNKDRGRLIYLQEQRIRILTKHKEKYKLITRELKNRYGQLLLSSEGG